MRAIFHVDLDAFYSSIEQRDRPELRGKPVVVGGDPDARGVVATASYEARRFGIQSAMPCRTARRLCPDAIFVTPGFDVYRAVSSQLRELFRELTEIIEPISLDEAFLDVSTLARDQGEYETVARRLKERIRDETDLTASIGVAANKLVAKVASDFRKPDGLTVVPAGREREFLAPLPVRRLFGIGPRSEERLAAAGLHRVAQLAAADSGWLVSRFGQVGLEWQRLARGIDDRPVEPDRELKQISRELTFPRDLGEREDLLRVLSELVRDLIPALRDAPPGRTLTLKMRYADWTTVTRRRTPGTVVTERILAELAPRLFGECWNERPLRLMGLGISNFVTSPEGQPALFEFGDM